MTFNSEFSWVDSTYWWQCCKCGSVHSMTVKARPGQSVFQPTLPAGWAKINGDLYCTAHVVLVDGKAPQ